MDKNELERYKQEMMKLYGRSRSQEAEQQPGPDPDIEEDSVDDVSPEIVPEEIEDVKEDTPDDSAWHPHSENDQDSTVHEEDEFNTKYPEPDLTGLNTDDGTHSPENSRPPEYFTEESLGDSIGYILVNVRTGDESSAVEGASVMVTAIVEGSRVIIASGVTDQSGTAPKFEVPAPDLSHSQAPGSLTRPYNLFDVSVTAEGFFNARSVDVPVFSGITSVQNFSMIPVPLMMSSSAETVTIYNQEPSFGAESGKE
ncbi:MAG: carboxypeptidase regulatory-like domain-containing protein [Ruminococcus sp.]|nr:carboxypeptidase regulatory-like domain-containing protein [Ruminococcus sp.]